MGKIELCDKNETERCGNEKFHNKWREINTRMNPKQILEQRGSLKQPKIWHMGKWKAMFVAIMKLNNMNDFIINEETSW